jgi:large conductance mechanosensitive channel
MLKEFREFVMRGNVLDMAVGIVIGAAFGAIVSSFVNDVLMPPIGMLVGGIDFSRFYILLKDGAGAAGPYANLAAAKAAGAVTLNYGVLVNAVVSFLIVAFAIFLLVRSVNAMRRRTEAPPEPAPVAATPEDILLLREIRNALVSGGAGKS